MRRLGGWPLLALLLLDAVILAVLEVFFLPLRLDGWSRGYFLLPRFADLPFPVTAVVAAVATPWLVRCAARISPRALVAGSPLLVWLAAVLGIWFAAPGGVSALLPDWRSLLLLGAGALPSAWVLGRVLGAAPKRGATETNADGHGDQQDRDSLGGRDKPGRQA